MRAVASVVILALSSFAPGQAQTPLSFTYQAVDLERPGDRSLGLAPVLSVDEPSGCILNRVRSVAIRPDSSIVIANTGNGEVCFVGVDGRLLRRVGRGGSGPGEYRDLHSAQLIHGDSILVVDLMLRRLSVLEPNGTYVRSVTLSVPAAGLGSITRVVALADGSILVGFSEVTSMAPRPEPVFFGQQLFRYGPGGDLAGPLGQFTESEHFVQETAREFGGVAYWDLAFGKRFVLAPLDSGFIGGDGAESALRQYDSRGEVIAVHRLPVPVRPVTREDITQYRRDVLARARPERRSAAEAMVEQMPYPKTLPVFNAVLADGRARIWVKVSTRASQEAEQWIVLNRETRTSAVFTGPSGFSLLAVAPSLACGVFRDDLDVESVRCFGIRGGA